MKTTFLVAILSAVVLLGAPSAFAATAQQDKMTECNGKASGMTGDARKAFMKECLSGGHATAPAKECKKGKLCGNTCIAVDKVCHK